MQKFDFIVPFGAFCITSQNLRKLGLQAYSLPFDWIANAEMHLLIELIENNFENFINKTELKKENHYKTVSYIMPNGLIFPHDFTIDDFADGFDQEYIEVEAKYKRRCKRLLAAIREANDLLFFNCSFVKYEKEDIEGYLNKLKKLFPNKNIKLFYLYTNKKIKGAQILFESPEIRIGEIGYEEFAVDHWEGTFALYQDLFADLTLKKDDVYKQADENNSNSVWLKIRYKIIRFFGKIICLFLPKKAGHQLNDKIRNSYRGR